MGVILEIVLLILGIKLLIDLLPVIFGFLKYVFFAIPVLIFLFVFVPGFLDEGGLLVALLLIACFKGLFSDSLGSGYGGYSGGYVLNKKTGVIHDKWDDDVDKISDRHRRDISYSDARELIGRGTRYRFRKK